MLRLLHLSKVFNRGTVNEKVALDDLSLELKDGDFATIVGSNGAGKSTMFNAIAGSFFVKSFGYEKMFVGSGVVIAVFGLIILYIHYFLERRRMHLAA